MSKAPHDTVAAPSSGRRRNLLLVILALLTIGLAYDFAVARPAVEQAYATVVEKNVEFNAESKHQAMGVADIHKLLDRKPSRTFNDGGLHVEVYSWRSGLPFRTHDLFVVYRPVQGENFFVRLTKFGYEPETGFQAVFAADPQGPHSDVVISDASPSVAVPASVDEAGQVDESQLVDETEQDASPAETNADGPTEDETDAVDEE